MSKKISLTAAPVRLLFFLSVLGEEGVVDGVERLAQEREDEERQHGAPDERVDDHDGPPENATARRAKRARDDRARPAEPAAEDHEQDEVNDA